MRSIILAFSLTAAAAFASERDSHQPALSATASAATPSVLRNRPDAPLGQRRMIPASGPQFRSEVASDGDGYLAVWQDQRALNLVGSNSEIYGSRIDSAGRLLDPMGIRIARPMFSATLVDVAWNGDSYLVAWEAEGRLRVTRLSADGEVPEPDGMLIPNMSSNARLVSNGDSTLILARGFKVVPGAYQAAVFSAILTREGKLARGGIPFAEDTVVTRPSGVWDGQRYRVVWASSPDLNGSKAEIYTGWIDERGELHARRPLLGQLAADLAAGVQIAWNGSRFLVVYRDPRLMAMLLDTDGQRLGEPFVVAEQPAKMERFAVASDGRRFIVTWSEQTGRAGNTQSPIRTQTLFPDPPPLYDIFSAIVDDSGTVSRITPISSTPQSDEDAAVASNGSTFFITWTHIDPTRSVDADVHGVLLSAETPESRIGPAPVAYSTPAQRSPAIAGQDGENLVVWAEELQPSAGAAILASRISNRGELLDLAPLRVSESEHEQSDPGVAFGGGNYLVVWFERAQGMMTVRARRVSRGGSVVGDAFEVFPNSGGFFIDRPSVASNGKEFVIAAGDQVAFLAFTANQPLISIYRFEDDRSIQFGRPSVVWTGSIFILVVSRQCVQPCNPAPDIFALRISANGVFLDSQPFPVVSSGESDWSTVACQSDACLIVWTVRGGLQSGEISAEGILIERDARTNGNAISSQSFLSWTTDMVLIRAFDGYLLFWSAEGRQILAVALDKHGMRIDGSPVDPAFPVIGSGENESRVDVRVGGAGVIVLVYERVAADALHGGVPRVFFRSSGSVLRRRIIR